MISVRQSGFFLIEFLIYLCLFSCISVFLMHFIVTSTFVLRSQSINMQRTMHFLTALDLMHREIVTNSSAAQERWLKTDKDCLIWHSQRQDKDCAFCLKDKKLVHIKGKYEPKKRSGFQKKPKLLLIILKTLLLIISGILRVNS